MLVWAVVGNGHCGYGGRGARPRRRPCPVPRVPGGGVGATGLTGQAHGPAPESDVTWFLNQVEQIYPGTLAAYTGRAYEDHWALDPWVHGAYSYARVGQAATYVGLAAQTEGAIHFAGEHTSVENQGFLDGGVETGERAAREILHGLGFKP